MNVREWYILIHLLMMQELSGKSTADISEWLFNMTNNLQSGILIHAVKVKYEILPKGNKMRGHLFKTKSPNKVPISILQYYIFYTKMFHSKEHKLLKY